MIPKTYQILTNLSCNLRCTYCYENKCNKVNEFSYIKNYLDDVFEKDFKNLKEKIETEKLEMHKSPFIIDLIGGESLLYPNLCDEILEYAVSLCEKYNLSKYFIVSISSNATLLTKPEVQEFVKKWKKYLNIGVSIDGTKELHNACRIYPDGRGSYDDAVAGYNWLKTVIPPCRISVKATYCHETITQYFDGIVNLINLGFTDIAANVIYEEIWTNEDALIIKDQFQKVVDYLFDNNLEDKVHIFQLNHKDMDMKNYQPYQDVKNRNWCGSCEYMKCLGFDGKLYGCNRFCTMKEPIEISDELTEAVKNQYKYWPKECKECKFFSQCASCAAIPYEVCRENPMSYFEKKGYCGFTKACVWGKLYFKYKLLQKLNKEKEEENKND